MAKNKNSKSALNSPRSKSDDLNDYSSLKTVLFYCSLIVFMPIVSFFASQNYVFNNFNLTPIWINIWSAVCAVIALHFGLFLYIYRAYFGSSDDSKED